MRKLLVVAVGLVLGVGCGKGGKPEAASAPGPAAPAAAGDAAPAPAAGGAVRVTVDPRIELISILERLAGGQEYSQGFPSPYRDAVDAHFASFRDHAAVALTKKLRDEHGIAFNAPVDSGDPR